MYIKIGMIMDSVMFSAEYVCISKSFLMNLMFLISVALQLTAGLLLVGNTTITRKGIIKEYCCKHTQIGFNKDGTLADNFALKEVVKSSWINRLSFSYLFTGYLLSIFGEAPQNRVNGLIIILIIVTILVTITFKFANYKKDSFEPLHLSELPLENGVGFAILDDEANTVEEILEDNKLK